MHEVVERLPALVLEDAERSSKARDLPFADGPAEAQEQALLAVLGASALAPRRAPKKLGQRRLEVGLFKEASHVADHEGEQDLPALHGEQASERLKVDAGESERVCEEEDRGHPAPVSADLPLVVRNLVRYHVEALLSRVDADACVLQLADHARQVYVVVVVVLDAADRNLPWATGVHGLACALERQHGRAVLAVAVAAASGEAVVDHELGVPGTEDR